MSPLGVNRTSAPVGKLTIRALSRVALSKNGAGEFSSTFPVQVTQTRKNGFVFTLGNGSGRLDLESFQGNIRLARPAQMTAMGEHPAPKPGFKFQFGANAEHTADPDEEE